MFSSVYRVHRCPVHSYCFHYLPAENPLSQSQEPLLHFAFVGSRRLSSESVLTSKTDMLRRISIARHADLDRSWNRSCKLKDFITALLCDYYHLYRNTYYRTKFYISLFRVLLYIIFIIYSLLKMQFYLTTSINLWLKFSCPVVFHPSL